jgi:hypothetical protein
MLNNLRQPRPTQIHVELNYGLTAGLSFAAQVLSLHKLFLR